MSFHKKFRTRSEGVASFAFSLLLLLGHALISTPVLSFTQVLIWNYSRGGNI